MRNHIGSSKPELSKQNLSWKQPLLRTGLLLSLLAVMSGCGFWSSSEAQSSSRPGAGRGERGRGDRTADGPVAVQTAVAEADSFNQRLNYTGTTRPSQQVSLKAQVSGEVTNLFVEVGDAIAQGMPLVQLDGNLQTTNLNQAQAELSARQAATAQAEVSIRDAQAEVVQAQATFDQARLDADRLRQLADRGAISQQEAEAAELAAVNAQQAITSAQAQVDAQQQAIASAADQVDAQQAVLAQSQRQLSYADLRSPLTGVVLSRQADIGDFISSGTTILELGDLSSLDVTVQVSELDLSKISLGQLARVTLDAFPSEGSIVGRIKQISPLADSTSRLVPVEVTIPNSNGQIGSGLLARIEFSSGEQNNVVVPASALATGQENNREGNGKTVVFIVESEGTEAKAIARTVSIGQQNQDRAEILSGLEPGDNFVTKSDRPLTDGQIVRLSILSNGQPTERGNQ